VRAAAGSDWTKKISLMPLTRMHGEMTEQREKGCSMVRGLSRSDQEKSARAKRQDREKWKSFCMHNKTKNKKKTKKTGTHRPCCPRERQQKKNKTLHAPQGSDGSNKKCCAADA
jgi:hypothetical protein